MRTIGLIGGMSRESTVPYYREVNERVRLRRGGLHSARVVLYSVDFADVEPPGSVFLPRLNRAFARSLLDFH